MKRMSLKQGVLFFYICDGIFLLLLLIAFLPFTQKNKAPSVPTALLNPNYRADVFAITISDAEASITLKKKNNVWIGMSTASNGNYVWPADIQNVENAIDSAVQIMQVQVKTEKVSSWKSLEVDDGQATSVTFYDENRNVLSHIFFGLKDSLSQKICFRTWTKSTVYEGMTSMESFLNTDESFWADPFLCPQCITGYDRMSSESLLRRGQIQNIAPRDGLPIDFNLKKDLENGGYIKYAIYRKDKEYIVIPTLMPGPAASEKDAELFGTINYRYSISSVTLEKLL